MRVAILIVAIAGCQPMYGGPSEHLHKVVAVRPPPTPPPPPVAYVDECNVNFHASTRGVVPKPDLAEPLIKTGDASVAAATPERPDRVASAIQHYGDALRLDPYNAHATVQLAVAYDRVLHRGCALAMLHRLETLSENPKFARDANGEIDNVVANATWFKGYRADAIKAVRP
jgi:hypothetical protein